MSNTVAPRISIVMPSFNQACFIESAIQSVLDQDVDGIELVIADGGSTDGTLQILEQTTLLGTIKLVWVSESDNGPADAINKAIAMASGPVIGWLNSDDMYAAGAISRALAYLDGHPGTLMVYGQGEHIDASGKVLEAYPTLGPDVALETFKDGCFICQPTAFVRREVFDELGFLDEGLSASFDFELWLRIFKAHRARIGFIDHVLAYSRLHANTITGNFRKNVALEGMQVVSRHLGSAPAHWLLTYFDELFQKYPYVKEPLNAAAHCVEMLSLAKPYLEKAAFDELSTQLDQDQRLALAQPESFVTVFPDGWMPPLGYLRIRLLDRQLSQVRLFCRHAPIVPGGLSITLTTPWGMQHRIDVSKPGLFDIVVGLPEQQAIPTFLSFVIRSDNYFVPSRDTDSNDHRELAFLVEKMELS